MDLDVDIAKIASDHKLPSSTQLGVFVGLAIPSSEIEFRSPRLQGLAQLLVIRRCSSKTNRLLTVSSQDSTEAFVRATGLR